MCWIWSFLRDRDGCLKGRMGRAAARKRRLLGHKERVITCVVLGQLPTSTVLHEQNFTILLARITHLTS
jgi:hypothetical protein